MCFPSLKSSGITAFFFFGFGFASWDTFLAEAVWPALAVSLPGTFKVIAMQDTSARRQQLQGPVGLLQGVVKSTGAERWSRFKRRKTTTRRRKVPTITSITVILEKYTQTSSSCSKDSKNELRTRRHVASSRQATRMNHA